MLVCQCHSVSDRAVQGVLDAGATRVGQVVRGTRAGTDCGGCLPQLRALCEAYFAADAQADMLAVATG